jgi:hypothetical protein
MCRWCWDFGGDGVGGFQQRRARITSASSPAGAPPLHELARACRIHSAPLSIPPRTRACRSLSFHYAASPEQRQPPPPTRALGLIWKGRREKIMSTGGREGACRGEQQSCIFTTRLVVGKRCGGDVRRRRRVDKEGALRPAGGWRANGPRPGVMTWTAVRKENWLVGCSY